MGPASYPEKLPARAPGVGFRQFLLIAIVLVVFYPVLGFEFLNYDDPLHIYENPLVIEFSPAALAQLWTRGQEGLYIPLTYSFWGGLASISAFVFGDSAGGLKPGLFHGLNLLLHLVSTLVVFEILQEMLRSRRGALLGALLFAIHPVQVEAVAWATGLKDLLAGFFALLALRLYLLAGAETGGRDHLWWRRFGQASFLFVAALLAKPSAVVLPLLAATCAYFYQKRLPLEIFRELFPWLLLALPLALVTKLEQPGAAQSFLPEFWQRPLIFGDALLFYLGKLIWPGGLAIDYGRTPEMILSRWWIYATGMLPWISGVILIFKYHRSRFMGPFVIFVVALLPVSGLLTFDFQKISTVADRYLYLALLGPALLIGSYGAQFSGRAMRGLFLVVMMLYGAKAAVQTRFWRDTETLYRHALVVNPRSWFVHNNLGAVYGAGMNYRAAGEQFELAIRDNPAYAMAYNNLGRTRLDQGDTRAAIALFRQALILAPANQAAERNLAQAYLQDGQLREAMKSYRRLVELAPDDVDNYVRLGELCGRLGLFEDGLQYYRKALALNPEDARGHAGLGLIYRAIGQPAKAIAAYRQALLLKPDFAEVYNNLGIIHEEQGRRGEALDSYRQALTIRGDLIEVYNNLALLYQKMQRSDEAIILLRKALEIYPDQLVLQISLGQAYVSLGLLDDAEGLYRRILIRNPEYPPALVKLAEIYRQTGRLTLAEEYRARAARQGLVETGKAGGHP